MQLLEKHRSRAAPFDCIATVSGGRDSAYVLLKLVKDYGLNVLAAHFENPFASQRARRNVQRMVRELGVQLVTYRLNYDIQRIVIGNILAWLKKPSAAMIPVVLCLGCREIWPGSYRIARRYGVRCIVGGSNRYEDTSFKRELVGVRRDCSVGRKYLLLAFGYLRALLANASYLRADLVPLLLRAYFFASPHSPGSRWLSLGIDEIDLFDYIPWEEEEVQRRIVSELGWSYAAESGSAWRMDCVMTPLKDLMYLATLGATERDDFYSKLVREGVIDRQEALRRTDAETVIDLERIEGLLGTLGLKHDDIQRFVALRQRTAPACPPETGPHPTS